MGGQQPVSGATLQLYAVGTGGDGSAANPLLSPAAMTDANGNFTISGTYTCPGGNPLVYMVATGGNPGAASSNSNLALMAALGPCNNLSASTYITINELTTVGAVYPLAAFMTSAGAIGSGAGDAAALASAFTLASELVNTSTGTSPGASVPVGTTIPVAQIDTIADILANCINSTGGIAGDGSGCGNLFALTTPGGSAAPTNTISALLYLANNPGMNTAALYALVPAIAPFQPAISVTPPDLGVRLNYPSGFTVSPGFLDFGALGIGSTSIARPVTMSNAGTAAVSVSSVSLGGADAADFILSNGCGTTFASGTSCSLTVSFAPTATGPRSAWMVIGNDSASSLLTVGLSGQGEAPTPTLSMTWPGQFEAGSPDTTLVAIGSGYTDQSVVFWNGSPLVTSHTAIDTAAQTLAEGAAFQQGGTLVTAGDSLCDGHGVQPEQAWPELLAKLPPLAGKVTATMTCRDGYTLANMAADYTALVHPLSPAVTGKAGVLFLSIYGNDCANMIADYGSIAGYEAAYSQYLDGAIADGWKIGFLAQWEQTGRQEYDGMRLAFNQFNQTSPKVTYYLDFTGTMNDPLDLTYYTVDGLHENVLGNAELAVLGQAVLMNNAATTSSIGLFAAVPASMLASAGTGSLTVVTPIAVSNKSNALPIAVMVSGNP